MWKQRFKGLYAKECGLNRVRTLFMLISGLGPVRQLKAVNGFGAVDFALSQNRSGKIEVL